MVRSHALYPAELRALFLDPALIPEIPLIVNG